MVLTRSVHRQDDPDSSLLTGSDQDLRKDAFRMTATAIEHDAEQAPEDLAPLFPVIRRLLFRSDLKLEMLREAAGIARDAVWRRFSECMGQSPWSYVREARLETAAMLLLVTPLKAAKCCRLVGYSSTGSFHRQFREFTGLRVKAYQQQARSVRKMGWMICDDDEAPEYWELAVTGQLSTASVFELDEYLERWIGPATAPPDVGFGGPRAPGRY